MLYFITSNKDKYNYASKELLRYGVTLKKKELRIPEIQSSNITEISQDKGNKAYKLIKSPLIITDTGWEIPSLNGFPGAYMHDITKWFTCDDFLNLIKDKKDKSILFHYVAIYKDKDMEKLFDVCLTGMFVNLPKGMHGTSLDKVITFRKDKKTMAQCEDEGINFHDFPEHPLWKVVGTWLKNESIN